MPASSVSTLTNEYQKYFSLKLLEHAIQLTVMDQFANRQPLPKKKGAKTISFFRRNKSTTNASGRVAAVQSLTEGIPISAYQGATLDRVDVPLQQFGEVSKVTDILSWTELFDAMEQNIELMGEDCALNADSIVRDAFVTASSGLNGGTAGVVLNQASGTIGTDNQVTERLPQIYAQGAANFGAMNALSQSGGKAVATDFIRAATKLKIARAPTIGGMYVAIIPPQTAGDLQNDPDWIDAANWGDPQRRFRGEVKNFAGLRFVEHTNPFIEDASGTEGYFAGTTVTQANSLFRIWVIGARIYGTPAIAGDNPFSPRTIIVATPDKTDPLNQYMTAGWKAFWAASVLNAPFGLSFTAKSEFA